MGMGMGRFFALGIVLLMGWGLAGMADRARAMGFCNCCASELTQSCGKVCAAISLKPGACPAIVDYEGTGSTAEGANPLNGMSLRDMALGAPTPWQLELFRQFLEKSRRQAISTYKKALGALKRKEIEKPEYDKSRALYDEALVNYYHGIRAYLNRVGTKSD